ncbi:Hypothetical protein A7982_00273 [Minicystis rosea]|nr:Hypothetical protein A7982_00273 [Minicystis rosea]
MTASQAPAPHIWFVYRSPHEGPLGKRVRRVAAASILAWFQAKIEDARTSLTPHRVADADLGGPVHGLAALFEAAKQHSLHTPKSSSALTKLLQEHLHGGADELRVDAHAIRVLTNDDDGEIAWFFFDEEALRKSTRNLAFLLHDEARLPDGDEDRPFAAPALPALGPAGQGEGATYACLLTSYGRRSLTGRAVAIQGVRLPALSTHLQSVTPDAAPDGQEGWPLEIRVLRALIDAGDTTIGPALSRAAAYPLAAVLAKGEHAQLGTGAHDAARAEITAAAAGIAPATEPPVVSAGEHAAFLATHASKQLGYQQWILFDDRWAAANPELATSLLHYAEHADPFAPLRATKAPATAAAPKAAAKPKAAKTPGKTKSEKAKSDKAASKDEQAWKNAIGDRDVSNAAGYRPSARFDAGGLLSHAKFGVGVVTRIEGTKVEVLFRDGPRLLVQGTVL